MLQAQTVLRRTVRRTVWEWRTWRHPLRTAPGLSMSRMVDVLARNASREALERVEEVRRTCHARSGRPRRHGSTRIEDCYFLYLLVRWLRPRTIFEVGTLIGTSASVMAEAQNDAGVDGSVFTVDRSYDGFEPLPRHAISCLRRQTSRDALEVLRSKGVRPDLVFLDGTIGAEEVAILNELGTERLVIATHDFKPPLDKGIRNAWLLSHHLADADRRVWVLPEHQGVGYPISEDVTINSSVAISVPEALARDLEDTPARPGCPGR